jgi:hypothetical protein
MKLFGIAAVIVSIAIAYYFFIFLPQQAADKKQAETASCLMNAKKDFDAAWADGCKRIYQSGQDGYKRCVQSGVVGAGVCDTIWDNFGQFNSTTCDLSKNGETLQKNYDDAVKQCKNL